MVRLASAIATGAVLLTASVVFAQDPTDPAATPAAAAEGPRWAGSEASLEHAATAISFDQGAEQTYNPTISQVIALDPRWRLNDRINLHARIAVETELTDSDFTTRKREPLLADTYVEGAYRLPALPAKIAGNVGLRLILPTSKESLARERIVGVSPTVTFLRGYEARKGITLQPFVQLRATGWLATATALTYDAPSIIDCGARCADFEYSGVNSTYASFTEAVGLNAVFPRAITASLLVMANQSFIHGNSEYMDASSGAVIPATDDFVRYTMIYAIEGNWQAHERVRVGLGFQTANPQQEPDSTYYRPFFNRYTQAVLKTAVTF